MTNEVMPPAVDTADDEIDLGELLELLFEGKWVIALIGAFCLVFGVAVAILTTPIFQADALVQMEGESDSLTALFGDMGDMLSSSSEATAEIELIKSRLVLGRTVEQLQLHTIVEPRWFPVVGRGFARHAAKGAAWANVLTSVFPSKFAHGDEEIVVGRFDVPDYLMNQEFVIKVLNEPEEYELYFPNSNEVMRGAIGSTLRVDGWDVVIQIRSLDAPAGREFKLLRLDPLSAVARLSEALSVSEKGKDSGIISIKFENAESATARTILNAVANNYLRQNVERKGEEAEQTLEYLNKQLPELRSRLDTSEASLNAYRTSQGSADLLQETQLVLGQSAELETLRLQLDQQREQLLQRYQPSHPAVQALDNQLADLADARKSLEKKIEALPETQQELLRLTRDVQVSTELYTALLNSSQQLEVAKAGTIGTVRIVDYAGLPYRPIKPKKALIVAVSLVLGVFLGVAAVFVRKALFSTVADPHAFESQYGLPVYANIPVSKVQESIFRQAFGNRDGMHVLEKSTDGDPALEAIKSLRTALHFGLSDAENNIVLITGPRPELGKSFVATNLASTMASAGKKVIVVDADMRRGTLHKYSGIERRPGLSDYLTGKLDLTKVARSTEIEGLFVMTSGTIPPNPSELLSSPQFSDLLSDLSAAYDVVILDSPPNLAVAEASILAQMAATVLLILRADFHPPREVAESIKRLRMVGGNVKGAVFNMVKQHARRYGYGRYNYYYSYSKSSD